MEPEVKEEIPAYMGSEALRSDSPAPCLQLVKEEPLAGSEHGMPGTAAQARLVAVAHMPVSGGCCFACTAGPVQLLSAASVREVEKSAATAWKGHC